MAAAADASTDLMRIGEVARRTGVAVSAVRYYETLGLLDPAARVSGKRRFPPEAVARVRVITTVQRAGFSLDEIRELLEEGPDAARGRRNLVEAKLGQVRRSIRRLGLVAEALEQALRCGCDSLEHCDVIASEVDVEASRASHGPCGLT